MMDKAKLDELFFGYGYTKRESTKDYVVYLLQQGMYFGAEIILYNKEIDTAAIETAYSKAGYSTHSHYFVDVAMAEDYLFKGFFQTTVDNQRIRKRYEDFANKQVRQYGDSSIRYRYFDVPYTAFSNEQIEGSQFFESGLVEAINKILLKPKAQLVIVEAAAGFGKTCTVFELYKTLGELGGNSKKPLFTELYRNRQAKIFKYVLYSEIDAEYSSNIKSSLVIQNIKAGRIPLIIDGFDELLSKNIDTGESEQLDDFEQVETMLSTIGELLEDNAKVILTSRKTAIFAGAEFGNWVESYEGKFEVTRFQLEKPRIEHWLPQERVSMISEKQIPISEISNPVLLTYLRYISNDGFKELLETPDKIIERYFTYLLEREKDRQNLIITTTDQFDILKSIALIFTEFNITHDKRAFIKEIIIDYNKQKLNYYRTLSPTKQTIEELAETLTNHALLDRFGLKDSIGFINDFVYGYLLGMAMLDNSSTILKHGQPIYEDALEKALGAMHYAGQDNRIRFWDIFEPFRRELSSSFKIMLDANLLRVIKGEYKDSVFASCAFEDTTFLKGDCSFKGVTFIGVLFSNCKFDRGIFHQTSFIGCKFKNCSINDWKDISMEQDSDVRCHGCDDFESGFITALENRPLNLVIEDSAKQHHEYEILHLYFKVDGKTPKMRYVSKIKDEFKPEEQEAVWGVFEHLRKDGLLIVNGNTSFISQQGISYYNKNYR